LKLGLPGRGCSSVVHMNWLLVIFLAISGAAAHCAGIGEVLDRSQQTRLEAFAEDDPQAPSTRRIHQSFEALLSSAGLKQPVELHVVTGAVVAETLNGRVIVANQSLGDLDEGARLFILAHELGHVSLKHWPQMTQLYQAWLPGELVQAQSDAVAALLGRDASALAYQQEFEADAFALRMLHALGRSPQDALSAFRQMGVYSDTATHPGTRKRLAALRAAETELVGAE
jgi:Zn-dependent protease with chaperone function